MGQVLIRNLDEEVIAAFKTKAALKGTSLEQELRDCIAAGAPLSVEEKVRMAEKMTSRWSLPDDFDLDQAKRIGRDDELFE
jgi:antitoxin FitA